MSAWDSKTASIVGATLRHRNGGQNTQTLTNISERERERERLGQRLKNGGVEMVVPATVDEEVEAIDGDQVGEWILTVDAAERRDLHRSPHFCPTPSSALLANGGMELHLPRERKRKAFGETEGRVNDVVCALPIIVALLNILVFIDALCACKTPAK